MAFRGLQKGCQNQEKEIKIWWYLAFFYPVQFAADSLLRKQ